MNHTGEIGCFSIHIIITLTAAFIAIWIAYYSYRRPSVHASRAFAFFMLAAAGWSLTTGLSRLSATITGTYVWSQATYFFIAAISVTWLNFAMRYTNKPQWVTPKRLTLFSLLPFMAFIFAVTNNWHHLIWANVHYDPIGPYFLMHIEQYGPFFWLFVAYSYSLLIFGTIYITINEFQNSKLYRYQSISLVIGIFLPLVINFIHIFRLIPGLYLDITPIGFAISSLPISIGLFKYKIFDLAPIAHNLLIDQMEDLLIVLDNDYHMVDINLTACELLNINNSQGIGLPAKQILPMWEQIEDYFIEKKQTQTEISWQINQNTNWYETSITPLINRQQDYIGWMITLRDITISRKIKNQLTHHSDLLGEIIKEQTKDLLEINKHMEQEIHERQSAENDLRQERDIIAHIMNISPVGIIRTNPEAEIVFANKRAAQLLDTPLEQLSGTSVYSFDWKVVISDSDNEPESQSFLLFEQILKSKRTVYDIRHKFTNRQGKEFIYSLNMVPQYNLYEEPEGIVITIRDVTNQVTLESHLQHIATHDSLTGLPNRSLLYDRLLHALENARRLHKIVAVLFLDLDGFKSFNDAFNHENGDKLLKALAIKMRNAIRSSDTVARIGGDEFVILLENVASVKDVEQIANKIRKIIAEPFFIQNVEVFITTSIGISIYPEHGTTPDQLLFAADNAMYNSKRKERNNFNFFSSQMAVKAYEKLELAGELRHALSQKELILYYQPQINISTKNTEGFEALIRWHKLGSGLILPNEFIRLAEETGLIIDIGKWVLMNACKQCADWHQSGFKTIRICVNVTERELMSPGYIDTVKYALVESGLDPFYLEIELSENIIYKNIEQHLPVLNAIRKLGVALAIDDFGSGYTSLNQLIRFPFDTLKLDKSLIEDIEKNFNAEIVIDEMILLAQRLGMRVIAEGVETPQQLALYQKYERILIQGWYHSKPVPAEYCLDWLRPMIPEAHSPQ